MDDALRTGAFREISGKHFHHKRAFDFEGVMVEVVLLEPASDSYVTNFWNSLALTWPADTLDEVGGIRVASLSALAQYRHWHARIDELRRHLAGQ